MDIVRFDRWARCVIRNKAYEYNRSKKTRNQHESGFTPHDEGWNDKYFITNIMLDDFEIEVQDGELLKCINELTERKKAIVMLHYFVGYTDRETGKILKIPHSTVHYNRKQSLSELKKNYRRS